MFSISVVSRVDVDVSFFVHFLMSGKLFVLFFVINFFSVIHKIKLIRFFSVFFFEIKKTRAQLTTEQIYAKSKIRIIRSHVVISHHSSTASIVDVVRNAIAASQCVRARASIDPRAPVGQYSPIASSSSGVELMSPVNGNQFTFDEQMKPRHYL